MISRKFFYIIIAVFVVSIFMLWQMFAFKAPEVNYTILKTDRNIEIRKYPAYLAAQVEVEDDQYTAIKKGFKILADYIFGNNIPENKISMTAPVIQQKTEISMTKPVSMQNKGNKWVIQFIMPSKYTVTNLPQPKNNTIKIAQIPEKTYVVIRFSGRNNEKNLNKHENLLKIYTSKNMLKTTGKPTFAFYNPPWILPFLRRNEIMLELKNPQQ